MPASYRFFTTNLREFRFWALNSYEEEIPKGWLGKVIDLTNQPYCGGG